MGGYNCKPECSKCPLEGYRRALPSGPAKAKVMAVVEAPSAKDEAEGSLLTDKAGDMFDRLIRLAGINRKDVLVTSLCQCRPPGNRKPTTKIRKCCSERLRAEIHDCSPEYVLLLGDLAQKELLPNYPVSKFHGRPVQVGGTKYVPMYHPARPLKSPAALGTQILDYKSLLTAKPPEHIETALAPSIEWTGDSVVALDVETYGLDGAIAFGAISSTHGEAYDLPSQQEVIGAAKKIKHMVLHNGKFDIRKLIAAGWDTWSETEFDDTMLLAYTMGYQDLGLKTLEVQELGLWHESYKDIVAKYAKKQKGVEPTWHDIEYRHGAQYCGEDTDATLRLWDYLSKEATDRELTLYNSIEKPLLPILIKMEEQGIAVDREYAAKWDSALAEEEAEHLSELSAYGISQENAASPKQLGEKLLEAGVPLHKITTSKQLSTDKKDLAEFAGKHRVIDTLLAWRGATKLRSTYTRPILESNGRIHTNWSQTRVATGRLASSNPNLQNLPRNKVARRPYCASPGCSLVAMDYGAIDLRVLAVVSGDERLLDIFRSDEDPHNILSQHFFGDVNPFHRYTIKKVAYSIIYGTSAKGLHSVLAADALKEYGEKPPTLKDCEEVIEYYLDYFSGVRRYQKETERSVAKTGYVDDWFGRRRVLPGIRSDNWAVRRAALREAINMPIAGTAGSVFKLAILSAAPVALPIVNLHDELIFDIPNNELVSIIPRLKNSMENEIAFPRPFGCPLKVTVKVGPTWGDLEEHKEV